MSTQRILVVEDEPHIADVVIYILQENRFETLSARDGDWGWKLFQEQQPDLAILDLNLPGISGLELFKKMRRLRPAFPIIMLTARVDELDRVLGLELGADDYITKPFSPRELAARVKAVLRRVATPHGPAAERLICGPLIIDSRACALSYSGRPVSLTRAEFKLMECLARFPAQVFSRDALIRHMHDEQHPVTDRSIDAYVKRLRRKFSEIRPDLNPIETVHGLGYKLNLNLENQA